MNLVILLLFIGGLLIVILFTVVIRLLKSDPEVSAFELKSFVQHAREATDESEASLDMMYAADALEDIRNPYASVPKPIRIGIYFIGIVLMIPQIIAWFL